GQTTSTTEDKHIGQVLSLGLGELQLSPRTSTCGIELWDFKASSSIIGLDLANEKIRNFNPKFFYFGLAKLCAKGQSVVSMTAAKGTIGYILPEVFSRNFGKVFGILLLKIIGGRKNDDANGETTGQIYFLEWIYNLLEQKEDLQIYVEDNEDAKIAKKISNCGTLVHPVAPDRSPFHESCGSNVGGKRQ
ncbi:rust resistance kinase lr10, partial [Quercus suber]